MRTMSTSLAPPTRALSCFRHTRGPRTPTTRHRPSHTREGERREPPRGIRSAASSKRFFDVVIWFLGLGFHIYFFEWITSDDDASRAPPLSRSSCASSWHHPHGRSEMASRTRRPRPRSVSRTRRKEDERGKGSHSFVRALAHRPRLPPTNNNQKKNSARMSPSSPPPRTPAPLPSSTATRAPSSPTPSSTTAWRSPRAPSRRPSRLCWRQPRSSLCSALCRRRRGTTLLPP